MVVQGGRTPLHHAAALNREDVVRMLLEGKADVNTTDVVSVQSSKPAAAPSVPLTRRVFGTLDSGAVQQGRGGFACVSVGRAW